MKVAVERGNGVGARIVFENDWNQEDREACHLAYTCKLNIKVTNLIWSFIKSMCSDMGTYPKDIHIQLN